MAGTSSYGVPGIRRVAAAHNRGAGILFLLLEGGYGSAGSVLVSGDHLQLQAQSVRLGYAPSRDWEWMFGEVTRGTSDSAYYSGSASTWTQFQLQGAYHRAVAPAWHVGGSLLLNLPAQTSGLGFAWSAFGGELQGRASRRVHRQVELSLNLGFLLDRTEHLLITPASRLQRLALNSAAGSRATWGIDVDGWFNPQDFIAVGGFAEVTGQWSPAGAARNMPVLGSLGLRAVPRSFPLVELSVGVDARLFGAPEVSDWYAGVLPWFAFAQLALHVAPFFVLEPPGCDFVPPPQPPTSKPQNADVAPAAAPPAAAPVITAPPPQVVISGSVLTPRGRPVPSAHIVLQGHEDVFFTTDAVTGRFRTLPLTCDTNVTVTAATPRGAQASAVVTCDQPFPPEIALVPSRAPPAEGVVIFSVVGPGWAVPAQGSVRCVGVKGSPFILEPGKPLRINLPPHDYRCTVAAHGFVPQHQAFRVQANRTTVFDIELAPKAPVRVRQRAPADLR